MLLSFGAASLFCLDFERPCSSSHFSGPLARGGMSYSKPFEHGHNHRKTDRYRVVRYFVIGAISTVMDFVPLAILTKCFGVKWYYANVASFTLTSLVHYTLSIRFVFESGARFAKHQEILLTFLASGVGLLVSQLALYVLVSILGLE